MKVSFEGFADNVVKFLQDHEYPHAWSTESLQRYCIMLRLSDDGATIGYVWASWHSLADHTLDFHVCVSEPCRGRWLTPAVLADLLKVADLFDATILMTTPIGPSAPLIRRLLRRLGFKPEGKSLFKLVEDPHGNFQ